jgi:hypothetical protein
VFGVPPPPSNPLIDPEPPSEPLPPDELPELPPEPDPLDDEDASSIAPASLPWLFDEPELPQPAATPTTTAARPASTERAAPYDVNGFPTSPGQRQGPWVSSCGAVAAEIGIGRAVGSRSTRGRVAGSWSLTCSPVKTHRRGRVE